MLKTVARAVRSATPQAMRAFIRRVGDFFVPVVPCMCPSMERSLQCLASRGFDPRMAVDVGAADGNWTRFFLGLFPKCSVLMVEPQESKQPILSQQCQQMNGNVRFVTELLGAGDDVPVQFVEMDVGSSVFEEKSPYPRKTANKATRRLDSFLGESADTVDFSKVDVQGYELEVLKGAERCLARSEAVLLEASLIPINAGCPLFAEVVQFMSCRGFRLFDICSCIRRKDYCLWQVDLLFVKSTSVLAPDAQLTHENWF